MPKEKETNTTKRLQRKVALCKNCGGYSMDISKCCKKFLPEKEQKKEMSHAPKHLQGKVALCKTCGGLSEDISRCTGCKKSLPEGMIVKYCYKYLFTFRDLFVYRYKNYVRSNV